MNRRRRPPRRARRAVLLGLTMLFVAILAAWAWLRWGYPFQPGPGHGEEVVLDVPWGSGPTAVARRAVEAGAVENARLFAWYLRRSGIASKLSAGRHHVRDDWSPAKIAEALTEPGRGAQHRVTIREGLNRFEIAAALESAGITGADEFLLATEDQDLLGRLRIPASTAEGYLFPETYQMAPGTEPEAVVERLVRTTAKRLAPLFVERREQLAALGREMIALEREVGHGPFGARLDTIDPVAAGRHSVFVIASLVEAETPLPAERPQVAAVAFNRLRSPSFPSRRLQFDPTVAYGCVAEPSRAPSCAGFSGTLATRHLEDAANRYNTYQHPGLPPGPIGNPSASSIRAVLDPADVDSLYFVANGEGGHVFSDTLEAHRKAVAAYRALGSRE